MPVSAHDVARSLRERLPDAGQKKLHKLLHYCQAWHVVHYGTPMFDETIRAYQHGPVVSTLWADEKYGRPLPVPLHLTGTHLDIISYVLDRYGHMSGWELEQLSHGERPWVSAYANAAWDDEITIESIRAFYSEDRDYQSSRRPVRRIVSLESYEPDALVFEQLAALANGERILDLPS